MAVFVCKRCGSTFPTTEDVCPKCDAERIARIVADATATDRDLLKRAAEALEWYLSRENPTSIRRDICELLDAIEARLKETT